MSCVRFSLESTIPGRVGLDGSVLVEINTNSAQLELGLWLSLAIVVDVKINFVVIFQ